jgi:hypothetical protein
MCNSSHRLFPGPCRNFKGPNQKPLSAGQLTDKKAFTLDACTGSDSRSSRHEDQIDKAKRAGLFRSLGILLSTFYYVKYVKRQMFRILNVDEIKN